MASRARHVAVLVHRYVGLAIAVFVAIAGLTGSLIAYREAVHAWIAPELFESPGRGPVLPPAELVRRVQAQEPRAPLEAWLLDARPGTSVRFYVSDRDQPKDRPLGYDSIFADPVTGAVLGRTDSAAFPPTRLALVDFLYRFHYSLDFPGRWGNWIMGIAAVLWFIDCFVGAWLTFPRGKPFAAKWKPAWRVKRQRLNHDVHRAGGLWFWAMLAVLALSSILFNLSDEVFMPVFGLVADVSPDPLAGRKPTGRAPMPVDAAVACSVRELAGMHWSQRPTWLYRDAGTSSYRVVLDKPDADWLMPSRRELVLDDATCRVLVAREPGSGTGGDLVLDWLAGLHVGSVLGAPYRVLLCVTGILIAALSFTGIVVWWRKREGRRRSRRRVGVGAG